ncbi:hypothetical protein [Egbenema bharatensis]|uniref:hypothetical protein n=1 Tax=Egbenema bharatensis TaxID=3463334 RepID=UPI003A89D9C8
MHTHFITLEVELQDSLARLHQGILTELQRQGEPLRWAITHVNPERRMVSVEAVITTPTEFLLPDKAVKRV